jgi:hypothetical protein
MSARARDRIAARDDTDQMMIAVVQPVRLRERLSWAAQQPIRAQRPLDIGFWDPMRNQLEMF